MKRNYSGTPRETVPLKIIDFFVDIYAKWIYKKRQRSQISLNPKILIASMGHLGDALTVSYLFPIIFQKYPNAVIDLISPTWCKAVHEYNPHIHQVYYIDHYLSNRSKITQWQKIKQHYYTFRLALNGLQNQQYDYYLDVRTSYGVSHLILPFINVNKAVGFNRRGLGGLLDVELAIPSHGQFHHFETYSALLKEIGIEVNLGDVVPYFHLNPSVSWEILQAKLSSNLRKPYILIFPETGEEHRQMSIDFWREIVKNILIKSTYSVIFCGQTALSSRIIDRINNLTKGAFTQNLIDASQCFSIQELAFLANEAQYALTLDSFPEHLCCIFAKL
ncbi:MAG: glycosyltransferase family 9 protein [Spirosomataceae bacterium]